MNPTPKANYPLVFDKRYTPSDNGRLSVHAEVWVDGVKEDRLTVTGRLSQIKPVVVAATRLERGQTITPAGYHPAGYGRVRTATGCNYVG